ncbi:amino acid adenylation domain-containing protein [Pluralibacter gergoviae]
MGVGSASQDLSEINNRLAADDLQLHQQLAKELNLSQQQLTDTRNLIQSGLDSMRLMNWLNWFRKRGYAVTLRELYADPTLKAWRILMEKRASQTADNTAREESAPARGVPFNAMSDGVPFPLTPVQHAYLTGRLPGQVLGGVGCHLYQEFDGSGLSAHRLEQAINTLIQRHPMLHIAFRADGQQYYQQRAGWNGATVHDLRQCDAGSRRRYLDELRERLSHRLLRVDTGETFDFQLSLLPDNRHRLHVNIDLLIMDASSFTLFFNELNALLAGETLPALDADYDFRAYVLGLQKFNRQRTDDARAWWLAKSATLPPAPVLPLACEPAAAGPVRNTRRRITIPAERWKTFCLRAGACGVTPTMALATCFSAVLGRWGGLQRLLLNVTLFDRQPLHPSVASMFADFTNILLLDTACSGDSVGQLAYKNQLTFTEAWEHRHWSGVELMRELRHQQRYPHGAPVVFTSNLGRSLYSERAHPPIGEPQWGISQTPQVWIDHLAFEHNEDVCLQWDSNEALFPPGLVETLFTVYSQRVNQLCDDETAWQRPFDELMPAAQQAVRRQINHTQTLLPQALLHEGIFRMAQQQPEALAVTDSRYRLRYRELADAARRAAGELIARGVQPGDNVVISMSKGVGQVVAALAVLLSGAVYVPVSLDQPAARREKICTDAGARLVLICQHDASVWPAEIPTLDWQQAIKSPPLASVVPRDPAQPAYIIYTSGSTGTPKGVVVSHRSALNTCLDINSRYQVNAADRMLALSALHFDLSVYDIFGLLNAGGALVIVAEAQRRDPQAWSELIRQHRITLWNSVPALFDMLLTWCEGFSSPAPEMLRAVMLSGDWIGPDLPGRYRVFRPDGQFVAMGGATEAAIWSNVCEVKEVAPHWRSIPYGLPLSNQRYRVVDELGQDCPDWVAGELWIGGAGVAEGYFNDPDRTRMQFVTDAGERWYRTGDLGCYWPDGTLEFLGRRDKQVKIGGYRIELGEIEHALGQLSGVKQALVMAPGDKEKTLVACVVPRGDAFSASHHRDPAMPQHWGALADAVCANADRETLSAVQIADVIQFRLLKLHAGQYLTADPRLLMNALDIQPRWQPVVERWLDFLAGQQRLRQEAAGYRVDGDEMPSRDNSDFDALALSLTEILKGSRDVLTLLDDPLWSPESLALRHPATGPFIQQLAQICRQLSQRLGRPVRLLEVGARTGRAAESLLAQVDASQVEYIAHEQARELATVAQQRLAFWPSARVVSGPLENQPTLAHSADILFVNNALHRLLPDNDTLFATLEQLTLPGALVYVLEFGELTPPALLSTLLLTDGHPETLLKNSDGWTALFASTAFHSQHRDEAAGLQRFLLQAPETQLRRDPRQLQAALAERLPGWMVPQRILFLDAFPLTANGKIDYPALNALHGIQVDNPPEADVAQGETEELVAAIWQQLLSTGPASRNTDFFLQGGDSLLATRMIGLLHQAGYDAQLSDVFDHPRLADFAATLHKAAASVEEMLVHDPQHRFEDFALTDVQQAYLVGRQPGFALSGVGSHFFVEFDISGLDIARLETAWNRVVRRHDMLRAVIRSGRQQVLENTPDYVIPRHRLQTAEEALRLRETLSHQVIDPAVWPVFDLQAGEFDDGTARLWLCLDNLLLDGLSMQILLAEFESNYRYPQRQLPPLPVTFRDYLHHASRRDAPEDALTWWQAQLDTLPPAPDLPLRAQPGAIVKPHFSRLSGVMDITRWRRLKKMAAGARLTPSAFLLSAWATVLSAWSARTEFTLNLTLFDRRPVHPQIDQILGDFTSLMLVNWQPAGSWEHSAQTLQQRLSQRLNHREVSAIRVMRLLAQRQNMPSAPMPVVFTSALGFEQDSFLAQQNLLRPLWGISQTPQVWLDHQVYESDGELRYNWDFVDALFPAGQVERQFEQYRDLLIRLSEDEACWQEPPQGLVPAAAFATRASALVRPQPALPQPPATADEETIAIVCAAFHETAGETIAPAQNFFEAGATSLTLVQLHIVLQQQSFPSLTLVDLFSYPSPAALAAFLTGRAAQEKNSRDRPIRRRQRRT